LLFFRLLTLLSRYTLSMRLKLAAAMFNAPQLA